MIFTEVLKVRDELTNLAFRNNSIIANLLNASYDVSQNVSTQVTGILLSINNGVLKLGDDVQFNVTDIEDHLSDVIDQGGLTVSDILETVSSNGDIYATLSAISQKFCYSSRMKLTDVNQIIDNVNIQQTMDYDINSLKEQLVAVSDNDGFITCKTWLHSVSEWIKSCKDGADHQQPELDNSAPNVLSGIYNVLSSIAAATLQIAFGAMAAIFGALGNIISNAISNLFNSLTEYFGTGGEIDVTAPNQFTKGVLLAKETISGVIGDAAALTYGSRGIFYAQFLNLGFFFWRANEETNIRANAYATPICNYKYVGDFLNSIKHDAGQQSAMGITITVNSVYDQITSISKSNSTDRTTTWYQAISLWLQTNRNAAYDAEIENDFNAYSYSLAVMELVRVFDASKSFTVTSSTASNPWAGVGGTPAKLSIVGSIIIHGYCNNNNPTQYISDSTVKTAISEYLAYMYENRGRSFTDADMQTGSNNTSGMSMVCPGNPLYTLNKDYFDDPDGVYCPGYKYSISSENAISGRSWMYDSSQYIQADCLPTSFFATYNAVDLGTFLSVLILSSIVAIGAAVIATKVTRAIRVKKIQKQTVRARRLAALKQDYESDPDNAQKLHAYAVAVEKYNRLGRILHWGSYDAANGWINSYSSANNVVNSTPKLTSIASKTGEAIQKVEGVAQDIGFLPSTSDMDTMESNITGSIDGVERNINSSISTLQQNLDGTLATLLTSTSFDAFVANITGVLNTIINSINSVNTNVNTKVQQLSDKILQLESLIR